LAVHRFHVELVLRAAIAKDFDFHDPIRLVLSGSKSAPATRVKEFDSRSCEQREQGGIGNSRLQPRMDANEREWEEN
jgi:hypothetical protein